MKKLLIMVIALFGFNSSAIKAQEAQAVSPQGATLHCFANADRCSCMYSTSGQTKFDTEPVFANIPNLMSDYAYADRVRRICKPQPTTGEIQLGLNDYKVPAETTEAGFYKLMAGYIKHDSCFSGNYIATMKDAAALKDLKGLITKIKKLSHDNELIVLEDAIKSRISELELKAKSGSNASLPSKSGTCLYKAATGDVKSGTSIIGSPDKCKGYKFDRTTGLPYFDHSGKPIEMEYDAIAPTPEL